MIIKPISTQERKHLKENVHLHRAVKKQTPSLKNIPFDHAKEYNIMAICRNLRKADIYFVESLLEQLEKRISMNSEWYCN